MQLTKVQNKQVMRKYMEVAETMQECAWQKVRRAKNK